MQSAAIRIGTRGSPLARAQAEQVRQALVSAHDLPADAVTIVPIRTSGDAAGERPLAEIGGKGLFTKEIDAALRDGRIDIAVHSAKDMETHLAEGIAIAACLPRADVRDAFISPKAKALLDLPQGAVVGTSSQRRKALALRARPDVTVVALRGNVETRLRKLAQGEADATFLAAAGLARLGLSQHVTSYTEPGAWLPAAGQGVIAIAVRAGDENAFRLTATIDHADTSTALKTERAFLAVLDGSCCTPIGALARIDGGRVTFAGVIVKPDGSEAHEVTRAGPVNDAEALGADAGVELAARGGSGFFAAA